MKSIIFLLFFFNKYKRIVLNSIKCYPLLFSLQSCSDISDKVNENC